MPLMGALHGAANAAIMGGDIGEGAEFGAVGSVMNNLFGPIIGGGITYELSGGKFSAGAREGAYGVAASVAMSVAMSNWDNRTARAASDATGSVPDTIAPPRALKSTLGSYRDPQEAGYYSDNPIIYTKSKMHYEGYGIFGLRPNYGPLGATVTKAGISGSSRVIVWGDPTTMRPSSWAAQVVREQGMLPSTRWATYDWVTVPLSQARSLAVTKEAEAFFSQRGRK